MRLCCMKHVVSVYVICRTGTVLSSPPWEESRHFRVLRILYFQQNLVERLRLWSTESLHLGTNPVKEPDAGIVKMNQKATVALFNE